MAKRFFLAQLNGASCIRNFAVQHFPVFVLVRLFFSLEVDCEPRRLGAWLCRGEVVGWIIPLLKPEESQSRRLICRVACSDTFLLTCHWLSEIALFPSAGFSFRSLPAQQTTPESGEDLCYGIDLLNPYCFIISSSLSQSKLRSRNKGKSAEFRSEGFVSKKLCLIKRTESIALP